MSDTAGLKDLEILIITYVWLTYVQVDDIKCNSCSILLLNNEHFLLIIIYFEVKQSKNHYHHCHPLVIHAAYGSFLKILY